MPVSDNPGGLHSPPRKKLSLFNEHPKLRRPTWPKLAAFTTAITLALTSAASPAAAYAINDGGEADYAATYNYDAANYDAAYIPADVTPVALESDDAANDDDDNIDYATNNEDPNAGNDDQADPEGGDPVVVDPADAGDDYDYGDNYPSYTVNVTNTGPSGGSGYATVTDTPPPR